MKSMYYKLNSDHTTEETTMEEFALYCDGEADSYRVGLCKMGEDLRISTVFLGVNYAYSPNEPPLLFETMVFGGEHDLFQERYRTWDEAVEGHARAIEMCGGEIIQVEDKIEEKTKDRIENRFEILDL
jgi:hypothetical protein